MKTSFSIICLFLVIPICFSQSLKTPTLSPYSKISQQIGLTEVSLEYSRPSAKGRTIFGKLVPYDQIWRTGANASTKITLKESAKIGDKDLEAGTYAIYTIPGKKVWTIIIHSNIKLRSIAGNAYKKENDVFRFEVNPQKVKHFTETFTIQFSDIGTNSLNIQMSWENTIVNIPVEVEVDEKIAQQMDVLLKDPDKIPHRTYFKAAQYYLTNNKDLNKALSWIESALKKSPENFRYGLLKAKIQDKKGDQQTAMKTIKLANKWALDAKNANYIGQTELFMKTLNKK